MTNDELIMKHFSIILAALHLYVAQYKTEHWTEFVPVWGDIIMCTNTRSSIFVIYVSDKWVQQSISEKQNSVKSLENISCLLVKCGWTHNASFSA